ncbi:MAG TPA: hypothetical protein VN704_00025 [Verrucomicrobiae bacterium]|nr:hypothetical protein [Verrucomicrobiae bacterium]
METTEIIGVSSSSIIALAGIFFTESIKEVIKKYFSIKTKKKATNLYWVLFVLAVALPILIFYLPSANKNHTKDIINPTNKIEPIQKQ